MSRGASSCATENIGGSLPELSCPTAVAPESTTSPPPEPADNASPPDVDPAAGEGLGHSPFPIVAVGASAGGFEAFSQLLGHLPDSTGMAFLFVQHLDPHHESQLTELLAKVTRMTVVEASHGLAVQPDHVYVIPPNTTLGIAQGALQITPRGEARVLHLPVDHLFRALAEDQQARAIGVVLSGTGSDGTLGLHEIKAVGGITLAQEERSARQGGMPKSAVDSGCVDFAAPVDELARRLVEIARHQYHLQLSAEPPSPAEAEEQLERILITVRTGTGVDFREYRDSTLRRRILRRMALHGRHSHADYLHLLRTDRNEIDALYQDLLINVTSFFRDPEMFDSLQRTAFPAIMRGKSAGTPIRVWVAGCSTGQEAYSLAMALWEFLEDEPRRPPVQIFATDLSDPASLDRARAGLYPESIESEVSPARLRRFFTREDHMYRICKEIRDACVFARQNVTVDPPFSHMHLISCRNVLIYMSASLQKRVLPTFHYALDVPGFLVLGTAESVGPFNELFDAVDREHKIYAKKATASRPPLHFARQRGQVTPAPERGTLPAVSDFQREADRLVLSRYGPAGVLVNESFDIVQFRGRTSSYLEAPPGEPTVNVLRMAREGLLLDLRGALFEAKTRGEPTRRERVRVRGEHEVREVDLMVLPIKPSEAPEGCLLVLFEDSASRSRPEAPMEPERAIPTTRWLARWWGGSQRSRRLERTALAGARAQPPDDHDLIVVRQELSATKEYLQSLLQQQDAANEELRSANEEIQSSNEELQSTNEELETAKEELQSSNEELTTVNEQLQGRNAELNQVNNDLINLQNSTTIPIILLGSDLRIRRFSAPAKRVLNMLASDVGRPIGDLAWARAVPELEALIGRVADDAPPIELETRDPNGHWYGLRILPYRTADGRIDGAVVLLVDIDQAKAAEQATREAHEYAEDVLRTADHRKDEFLATLAHELRNPLAAMLNSTEVMKRVASVPPAAEQARETLERPLRLLKRLVSDLLDVARIAENKVQLRPERISLATVIESAVESSRLQVDEHVHELVVTLPAEPVALDADPVRLGQVITNLLSNAAKFTPNGGQIRLSAEVDAAAQEIVISVRDTGIGIASDQLESIFGMFSQGRSSLEGARGGLGVGLALARKLTELHGGSIEARSAGTGQGSEFLVRLPMADPRPEAQSRPEPRLTARAGRETVRRASPQRRILVVDDNRDVSTSMGQLLTILGHEVRLAHDGPTALEAAREFVPDVALVDVGLPGIDGYEVARRMRQQPTLRNVLLVALTGWGRDEDRRRSAEAGFDHHLVKPVEIEELKRVLELASEGG